MTPHQLVLRSIVAGLLIACTALSAPAQVLAVHGRTLRLELSSAHGALVAIREPGGAASPLSAADTTALWELQLVTAGGRQRLTARDARRLATARPPGREDFVTLTWDRFVAPAPPSLRVTATVEISAREPVSRWHIRVEGMTTGGLDSLRFPRIGGIASMGRGEELAVPLWMGQRSRTPRQLFVTPEGGRRRLEWFYPGQLSLQALSLSAPGERGLYFAADDSLAYRKSFAMWSEGEASLGYEMIHLPENPATATAYAPTYAALVGTHSGDWLTAAERYRAWGTQQRWARESRLTRGQLPQWLTQTGLWIWNRGRSPGVLPPALALQRESGLPVSVFWHWWHKGAYDTSFPDYLPPREGAEDFTNALRAAQASGIHAIVYMNQRLWCLDTPSWAAEGAERWAVRNPDGSYRTEVYNIFDPKPCATMDIATRFWRDKYAGIGEEVLGRYGLDGIYMDQAVLSLVCWSPDHGHPVGGGHYWMDGFHDLATDLRRRAPGGKRVTLAGEGGGESWMPDLDAFLTLQVSMERYAEPTSGWEVIPFFQAVYHAHALSYGSYSSLAYPPYDDLWPAEFSPPNALTLLDRKYRRQFLLEQARAFVWGMQPTIANFLPEQLGARPDEMNFALQLARLRHPLPEYFMRGTMVRPPSHDAPDVDVDFSRVSIYAARRGGATEARRSVSSVQVGAFRSPDGRVAVAMASIVDEPLALTLDLDPRVLGIARTVGITRIDSQGKRTPMGTLGEAPLRTTVTLGPREGIVLELAAR